MKKILIIEKNEAFAEQIKKWLHAEKYKVHIVTSSNLKESKKNFDPDITLKDITTLEVDPSADSRNQLLNSNGIPTIFMANDTKEEKNVLIPNITPYGFLIKPFDQKELIQKVEMTLLIAQHNLSHVSNKSPENQERRLIDRYINSLPGLFYVFDDKQFVQWNRRWETVTGYSSEEISQMYGPDFFEGMHKTTIINKMGEVFEKGEADAEVELVTKDGKRISYYFNGIRKEIDGKSHLIGLGTDITKRKEAEEAYRETEFFLAQIFDQSSIGKCLLNSDGICIRVNPAFCELFNIESAKMIDESYNIFEDEHLVESNNLHLVKDVFEQKNSHKWELTVGDRVASSSVKSPTLRIEKRSYEIAGFPITDRNNHLKYVVIQYHDITKHKVVEQQLNRLTEFQESIIDNANIWLNVLDANADVVIWNKAAEQISGYSKDEVIGHSKIWEWSYPDEAYRTEIYQKAADIIEGEEIKGFETTIQSKDGKQKTMSWYSRNLLDDDGKIKGSIALGIDVTDRIRAEKERDKMVLNLQSALDEVKQLSGLIPICANCKKIRDDKGYWNQIEQYIEAHSEAYFSHSICHECAEELYKDTNWYKKRKNGQQ